jgi:hypothetical protein
LVAIFRPWGVPRQRNSIAADTLMKRGYLKFYADHVAPASEGAVLPR